MKKSICLYFQVHQPNRLRLYRFFDIGKDSHYYDDFANRTILRRVAQKCYLPMNALLLEQIEAHKGAFKVAFSISGSVLEQFDRYAPEVIESFRKLAQTGCVEFLSETYYHSLASLASEAEFKHQVLKHKEAIEHYFGVTPKAFRNTELIYSDAIGEMVYEMGFKTMLTEGAKHVLGWKSPNFVYNCAQAKNLKLNVYSGEKDPEFYDGAAVELTLKELRTNIQSYADMSVAFECVITSNSQDTVYVEQFDEESQMYYGISVYYGNAGLTGDGLKILSIGNKARIVGKVQYYETGDTWQISGLKYRIMKPNDPENIQQIGTGFEPAYVLTDAETFVNGTKDVMVTDPETKEDVIKSFRYNALAMNTSLEMKNLVVKSAYTTNKEESASYGAISLTCEVDGKQITVRTVPLYDADGKLITQDTFIGKTIDVKGIMDYYDGEYQIKVFRPDQITIH